MIALKRFILPFLFSIFSVAAYPMQVTHSIGNGVTTAGMDCNRYGCAVTSLTYRNKQYINNHDRGRQGQIALQLDGYGECWNPTEAGSSHDGNGPLSSSAPQAAWATQTTMASSVRAAYWSVSGNGVCPKGPHPKAVPQRPVSDTIFRKRLEVGALGHPNVIRVDVEIEAESLHRQVEIFTTYSSPEFGRLYRRSSDGELYQPTWSNLGWHTITDYSVNGNKNDVVVAATHDLQHAIALVRHPLSFKQCEGTARQYFGGHFAWGGSGVFSPGTTKLSVVAGAPESCGQKLNYYVYIVLGTVEQVKNTISLILN